MNQVEVAINACHPALADELVRGAAAFARRMDRGCVMTTAACHAVLAAHLVANRVRKLDPPRFPNRWVTIVVGALSEDVPSAFDGVGVGLDEPIGGRDMTVAAAWLDASGIAAVS